MNAKSSYNDAPIAEPSKDRFGIDPFAQTLASSIKKMDAPEGTVIALNGPWGSGKSSAVNLTIHHLADAIEADELAVINFACWWFRGEEALTLAFFRELYAGLGPTLGERFTKALPKLGARLLRAGGMVGTGIDLAGGAGTGALASGAMNWLSGLIQQDDTVEKLHADLVKVLGEQKKRFLIVIDDIDRLAPDEALLIFRLVKSVGRLPNVIYLLAFDRRLAEAVVAEKYPSEGPHYLEKIIQVGFDIPEPRPSELSQQLLEQIGALCGTPSEENVVRFMNIFYDLIVPEMKTPRDLVRLMNALSVTWPSIGHEVDQGDFIGLETLRVFRPGVHRAIRSGKERLCGAGQHNHRSRGDLAAEYDAEILASVKETQKERMKTALKRLFPRLETVWGNVLHGSDDRWSRDRRACSEHHFDTYFRLSLGGEALPKSEIEELIARADDRGYVKAALRAARSRRARLAPCLPRSSNSEMSCTLRPMSRGVLVSVIIIFVSIGSYAVWYLTG
jgi:predicted KAP-like P-loop ATPase